MAFQKKSFGTKPFKPSVGAVWFTRNKETNKVTVAKLKLTYSELEKLQPDAEGNIWLTGFFKKPDSDPKAPDIRLVDTSEEDAAFKAKNAKASFAAAKAPSKASSLFDTDDL